MVLEKKSLPKELKSVSTTIQPLVEQLNRLEIPVCLSMSLYRSLNSVFNRAGLCILDLSRNSIEYLPVQFSELKLRTLNLAGNCLWKSKISQWEWINGVLCQNLRRLDLSSNQLKHIPEQVLRLRFVRHLNFNYNNIKTILHAMGKLPNLRILYISENKLRSLPVSIVKKYLDKLDISHNEFHRLPKELSYGSDYGPVRRLLVQAGQVIHRANLSYNSREIPYTLVNLLDSGHRCTCGNVCFEEQKTFTYCLNWNPEHLARITTYSPEDDGKIHYCSVVCSLKCTLYIL